jgi:acyl transferase domain-containing protein
MAAQYTQSQILASLQDAYRRLDERSSPKHEPIAIIGLSCRLPGGVVSPTDYWQLLAEGRSGIAWLSAEELQRTGVDFERSNYVRAAAALDDVEYFDVGFFGIHPTDLLVMDPQHRLLLQGAWEALEDAGYGAPETRGVVGLFAGCSVDQYFIERLVRNPDLSGVETLQLATGNEKDYLASRIAYLLNLRGPAVNIQSACSTSLVAAHYAVQSLRFAECDMAIAGGCTVKVPHRIGYAWKAEGIRSSRGECRPFDALADGTVEGNGMALVVLKPLRTAINDRDHIYAVIRGSAVNNDGSDKVSFVAPSASGQEQVIVDAFENARVSPESIQYFEAHGTGTKAGDPIEVAAASRAFRRWTSKTEFCAIGSVKSNIGHADAAAGVAGLMKVALSLHHRAIPPSLNFTAPNPALTLPESPFYVNTTLRRWPECGKRRAAVSAFGIGGTNCHMVLEEVLEAVAPSWERNYFMVTVSAKTHGALEANCRRLADFLGRRSEVNLANVAYTLSVGRKAFSHRCVVIARDVSECSELLQQSSVKPDFRGYQPSRGVAPVFIFPGRGAVSSHLRSLYDSERAFRECVDNCLQVAKEWLPPDIDRFLDTSVGEADSLAEQVRELIAEYALASLWIASGVRPSRTLGKACGEYAAACISGILTLPEALLLLTSREKLDDSAAAQRFNAARDRLRLSAPAVEVILNEYTSVFLELGRGGACNESGVAVDSWIAMLPAGADARPALAIGLAQLWLRGVTIDWERFYAGTGCCRIPLPTYAFEKHRYWVEKSQSGQRVTGHGAL